MVYTVSDLYFVNSKSYYMIDNIIYIPMHSMHGSTADDKIVIAIGIAVAVLSFIVYIIGFLYDGIKNKHWNLFDISNLAKSIGGLFFYLVLVIWILATLAIEIYKYL